MLQDFLLSCNRCIRDDEGTCVWGLAERALKRNEKRGRFLLLVLNAFVRPPQTFEEPHGSKEALFEVKRVRAFTANVCNSTPKTPDRRTYVCGYN